MAPNHPAAPFSTATVTVDDERDAAMDPPPPSTSHPASPTVVLIEDNEPFRATLRDLLGARGIRIVGEAGDGSSGIAAVRALGPEVCVLDRRLPDADGFDVLDTLRRECPDTAVVVLTGYPDATAEKGAGSRGAYAFLLKPCPADLLVETVSGAAAYGRRART